jgi:hypothetical protein
MPFENIMNIWDNTPIIDEEKPGKRYITADIAFTSDRMVIMVWDEMTIIDIVVNPQGKTEDIILELAKRYKVPNYNIAYDSDGVGQFLKQRLPNAKPIVNNGTPFNKENYRNLKTQLYFKLADNVNGSLVKIKGFDKHKETIIEELGAVKYKPSDSVSKLDIIDKGEVKRLIGRSPDFSDAMAYRMFFEFKTTGVRNFRIG